jgi:hypothetical protein
MDFDEMNGEMRNDANGSQQNGSKLRSDNTREGSSSPLTGRDLRLPSAPQDISLEMSRDKRLSARLEAERQQDAVLLEQEKMANLPASNVRGASSVGEYLAAASVSLVSNDAAFEVEEGGRKGNGGEGKENDEDELSTPEFFQRNKKEPPPAKGNSTFEQEGRPTFETEPSDDGKIQVPATGLRKFRQDVFALFDDPDSSSTAKIIAIFVMLLIFIGSVTFVLETVPEIKRNKPAMQFFEVFEVICVATFTVDYVMRMVTCTVRPGENQGFCSYFLQTFNIIDIAAVSDRSLQLV